MNRRTFFAATVACLLAITGNQRAWSAPEEFADIKAQVTKQHDEAVKRLQDWIHQVSIAAENRGYPEGALSTRRARRDGRKAGRVRDTRCRRSENGRAVFHV